MRPRRRILALALALLFLLASIADGAPRDKEDYQWQEDKARGDDANPSGAVTIKVTEVGLGVGVTWGDGVLMGADHPGFALCDTQVDLDQRLAAGEIIVSTEEVPGKSLKCAEMVGVVDAPPEIVWQVINDVNNFKNFMPRTRNSMAVDPEKIPVILQRNPTRAEEVEQLLGPIPADPAGYRIPEGIYTVYFYSNLDLPWPCNNRWYIIKGLRDETQAAQHYYHSSWTLVTGNLRENSGEWNLEPFGSAKTKAIYRLCTDPGGSIPKFLVTQGTCTTMPQIIKAVRRQAANLLGQRQP